MQVTRSELTVLLNALYDMGTTEVTVRHPADAIGDLLSFELGPATASPVELSTSLGDYAEARSTINSGHGASVVEELPERQDFANAMLAGGLVQPANLDEIHEFLDRYGNPDLTAGHRPVVAGFDTNLLPWRMADVLGLYPGQDTDINGYALATGVRDELDWDQKRSDTRELEQAFGDEFDALWNQPSGARRIGRLGETYYRKLRDHRYADEIDTRRGDESIIEGYDAYQSDNRKDVLLFSNDRDFVERARSKRVLGQRVELPKALPEQVERSWTAIQDTLYVLTVLFGVLELPKVTMYGVWKGKDGQAWRDEALKIDCRSPKVKAPIERDLGILKAAE